MDIASSTRRDKLWRFQSKPNRIGDTDSISKSIVIEFPISVVQKWCLCATNNDYWVFITVHATGARRWSVTSRQIEFRWRAQIWEFNETGISCQSSEFSFCRWLFDFVFILCTFSVSNCRHRFGTTGAMWANANRAACMANQDDFVMAARDWRLFGELVENTGTSWPKFNAKSENGYLDNPFQIFTEEVLWPR